MNLTLQQLKLFETLSRNKSFTLAAKELKLSQPAVSIQVKRLEAQIGEALFEQVGKKIFPTEAGKMLYEASKDILTRVDQLKVSIDELNGSVRGPLQLSVVTTTKYFLPLLLGNFLKEYPDVEPKLTFTNREQVVERLYNNVDDFVILGQAPDDHNISSYPFLENILVPIAPPNHPLVGEKNIPLPTLVEQQFLEREPGSGTRLFFDQLLDKNDLSIKPYMELGSTEAVKQAVMANLGVAVVSLHGVRFELESGRVKVLDVVGFPLKRRWSIVHMKNHQLSLAAKTFRDYIMSKGDVIIQSYFAG